MLGTWMQQFAQGWVVAGLTSSAFSLGLVNFASGVPMLLLTMYGGVMADRFDKRRIMLVALAVQAALAVIVGLLVGGNRLEVWHIVAAGMCLGTVVAFEMPAASALVPELVEREHLRAAISVDRSVFHATRLAGPAQHGWLMASSGVGAFTGSLLLFAIPTGRRRGFMFAGIAAIALAMGGLATAQNLYAAIAAMIVLTLGSSTLYGLANTIVQERAPDYIRGRVSAISGMSFLGVLPFSGLIVSKFSDYLGMRTAMGTAAVCFGVIAACVFLNGRVAVQEEVRAAEV